MGGSPVSLGAKLRDATFKVSLKDSVLMGWSHRVGGSGVGGTGHDDDILDICLVILNISCHN